MNSIVAIYFMTYFCHPSLNAASGGDMDISPDILPPPLTFPPLPLPTSTNLQYTVYSSVFSTYHS